MRCTRGTSPNVGGLRLALVRRPGRAYSVLLACLFNRFLLVDGQRQSGETDPQSTHGTGQITQLPKIRPVLERARAVSLDLSVDFIWDQTAKWLYPVVGFPKVHWR